MCFYRNCFNYWEDQKPSKLDWEWVLWPEANLFSYGHTWPYMVIWLWLYGLWPYGLLRMVRKPAYCHTIWLLEVWQYGLRIAIWELFIASGSHQPKLGIRAWKLHNKTSFNCSAYSTVILTALTSLFTIPNGLALASGFSLHQKLNLYSYLAELPLQVHSAKLL
jgi:hypothetical protein